MKKMSFKNFLIINFLVTFFSGYSAYSQVESLNFAAEKLQQATHKNYISKNGKYYTHSLESGFDFWWNANGLDVLTDGYIRTRSNAYKIRMKSLLHGIRDTHKSYLNEYYDDMAWLALACIKAYRATSDKEYLEVADLLWKDILTGRSPEFFNAISWNKSCHPTCKNAISNSPASLIATQLYQIHKKPELLNYAKEIHAFVKDKLVTPNGGIYDSWNSSTDKTNKKQSWIFSYNVGMYLSASLELFKVTKDISYLNEAEKAADYAIKNHLTNGILFTNERGSGDGGLFKGIFVREFARLAIESALSKEKRKQYAQIIMHNANTLISHGTTDKNFVGTIWNKKPSSKKSPDYSTQLSGIMLLEAAVSVQQVSLYQDADFAGYSARLSPGRYTSKQLKDRGILNNDISSLAIPEGMEATIFDTDDFTGKSIKISANASWIGEQWNDRASSIIISRVSSAK